MSKKWTNQQKVLYGIKLIGGADVGIRLIDSVSKWGSDRVDTLFNAINENEMGIDNANNILNMSNELGPEVAKNLLWNALANKYADQDDNIILFRREA